MRFLGRDTYFCHLVYRCVAQLHRNALYFLCFMQFLFMVFKCAFQFMFFFPFFLNSADSVSQNKLFLKKP